MKQLPHYLLIGNGRVSCHMQQYFSLLNISFDTWSRHEAKEKLYAQLSNTSHVLVLINDNSIETFISEHLNQSSAIKIHFSGSVITEHAFGAHPLMSFSHQLLSLQEYQDIPFILDNDAPLFSILFPDLPNPHWRLNKKLKAKYHALCVLSGNFTTLLWWKLFHELERDFNLPTAVGEQYIAHIAKNIIQDKKASLTGPLVRNDVETIEKNLAALTDDPFRRVYQSFLECYQQLKKERLI